MSTLLEQAIVDAQALRNAALKNAEITILEKYGNEVRTAVKSLLEREEALVSEADDDLDLEDEFGFGSEDEEATGPSDPSLTGAEESPLDDTELDIPFASAEDEELCNCPDNEEEVALEFSLEDLKTMSDELGDSPAMGEPEPHEELFKEVFEPEEDEDEEVIDEDFIRGLVEELVIDMKSEKSGWLGTPEPEVKHAEEVELARLASTDAKEEMKGLKDAKKRLALENKSLAKDNKKLSAALYALKDKLEEVVLTNAKLLYVNQALNSPSLNERQKSKIVESIQKADSVKEAKVIFETLQSAVGTMSKIRRKPESLNEVIGNKPSLTMPRKRDVSVDRETLLKERLQRLAGIK